MRHPCVPGSPGITEPLAAVPDTGRCPGSSGSGDYDVGMTAAPVNVTAALASFDETYSPRIVARMNDYEVRVAHAKGEHVWHVHEDTDEFFLVLDGQFDVAIRDADGSQTTVTLRQGDTYVVPKGTEHKPSSPGASILMFEPSGTSSTGDRHEGPIPAHVDSTTGHDLD
jgi:mannose-6-phosphate isomerase-like protein (cupin superfamily)